MKYFHLLAGALLCLATSAAFAQRVELQDVDTRSFTGVRAVNNGEFYYTLFFGEKSENKGMANFVLAIYDKDLAPVTNKKIEVTKNSELAASAFSGKYFMFIFADVNAKTMTKILMDQAGNIVKRTVEEDVRRSLLVADAFPDVQVLNENEFLIIRPEKEKKMGYEISLIDQDLTSKWTKGFFPEKGIWSIIDSKLAGGRLYLLRREKPNALWGDKYVYAAQSINTQTGDAIYTTELKDDQDGGFPNFINVTEDGKLATGGMYFSNGKYDEKNSDGFFFAGISPEGTMSRFDKHTWKSVRGDIKGDWLTEFAGGKTKVLIEDLVRAKDGSYVLVGEAFRRSSVENTGDGVKRSLMGMGSSSSSTPSRDDEIGFTVLDFVMINFDADGTYKGISKVAKTSREAIVRGEMSKASGLELAQWMQQKKRFFTYRYMVENNNKQYIVYKNEDGIKTHAYFLPVGADAPAGDIDLNKGMSESVNKLGRFSKMIGSNTAKATFESTVGFGEPESREIYGNIIPAKEGSMLLYNFSNSKLTIWLEPIPAM
jgi:hypothetical protein